MVEELLNYITGVCVEQVRDQMLGEKRRVNEIAKLA